VSAKHKEFTCCSHVLSKEQHEEDSLRGTFSRSRTGLGGGLLFSRRGISTSILERCLEEFSKFWSTELGTMGNTASGNIADCCCESRSDPGGMQDKVLLSKVPQKEIPEKSFGVGLVFRTTRDGKMVVSSFVKDSSAYDCGLVRDGGDMKSCINRSCIMYK
jgi:hypothetical protein